MAIPQNWRLQHQRYRLTGEVCHTCGAKLFPPRDVCPECAKPAYEPFQFAGKGEVYSFTVLSDAPAGYEAYEPYPVALVKLQEGPLVTAQLTDVDPQDVRIGMPVEMVTRKLTEDGDDGLIVYGYKFRPVLKAAANG
ncbi:MAG: Zn-ribbon domain-containing OB-fold protein [Chloroflexi bacterium]|nr:Zn-ribbon domain-containing OB-fold protein [Chloroflexota bacterium]